jgi:hypothetical protein
MVMPVRRVHLIAAFHVVFGGNDAAAAPGRHYTCRKGQPAQ